MPRSKPFSGKQKKQQLKEKKKKKNDNNLWSEEPQHGDQQLSAHGRRTQQKKPTTNPTRSDNRNRSRSSDRTTSSYTSGEDDNSIGRGTLLSNSDEEKDGLYYGNKHHRDHDWTSEEDSDQELEESSEDDRSPKLKQQGSAKEKRKNPTERKERKTNRPDLRTVFDLETKEEILQRKEAARQPLDLSRRERPWALLSEEEDLFRSEEVRNSSFIPMPKRPTWSFDTPKQVQQQKELEIFRKWLDHIKETYPAERLNYFERNLEVWRQLWRVSERSDAVMLITDSRYPLFHFPPALYDYLIHDIHKPIILVLNKIDLVDRATLRLWEDYFKTNYPEIKAIVKFNSFSQGARNEEDGSLVNSKEEDLKRKKLRGRRRYEDAKGVEDLFTAIRSLGIRNKLTNELIHLPEDRTILREEQEEIQKKRHPRRRQKTGSSISKGRYSSTDEDNTKHHTDEDEGDDEEGSSTEYESHNEEEEHERETKDAGVITIGTVGHPNVGKSSLINGLVGRKVVSTSRTPGHTKHFQTIRLTPEVQLCDCPGLVFPALDRPKALQILCGLFPLAQVREPFSAIRYLSERVSVEKVYGLQLPEDETQWTPLNLCEAFATKRAYFIARSGRPDVHRAGLEILRDCLDGLIVISWPPPDTTREALMKAEEAVKKEDRQWKLLQWKKKQEDDDDEEEEEEEEEEDEEEITEGEEATRTMAEGELEGKETSLGSRREEEDEEEEEKETEEESSNQKKKKKGNQRRKRDLRKRPHNLGTAQSLVDSSEEVSYGNEKYADRDLLLLANMKNASPSSSSSSSPSTKGLRDQRSGGGKLTTPHSEVRSGGMGGKKKGGKKGGKNAKTAKAQEYQQRLAEKQHKELSLKTIARSKH